MNIFQISTTVFLLVIISTCHGCGKYGGGGGPCGSGPSSINSAVISKHVFKVKSVPSSSDDIDIPTIIINSGSSPLRIQMGSSSSDVQVESSHSNTKPQVKYSSSVDGTIYLKHFVKKPIIQNVYETIIPSRKVIQKVLPVKEYIKTIVSQEATTGAPDTTPMPKYYYKHKPKQYTTAPPTTEAPDDTTAGEEYMEYFY